MKPEPARIPNFKRFLFTGAILGLVAGVVVAVLVEPGGPSYISTSQYDPSAALPFFGALGAFLGTGLAGILAVVLDRSGRQK